MGASRYAYDPRPIVGPPESKVSGLHHDGGPDYLLNRPLVADRAVRALLWFSLDLLTRTNGQVLWRRPRCSRSADRQAR
jgi:hypothetical protein